MTKTYVTRLALVIVAISTLCGSFVHGTEVLRDEDIVMDQPPAASRAVEHWNVESVSVANELLLRQGDHHLFSPMDGGASGSGYSNLDDSSSGITYLCIDGEVYSNIQGRCMPCPNGTYYNVKDGDNTCTLCVPEDSNSTEHATSNIGSMSIQDCYCLHGYEQVWSVDNEAFECVDPSETPVSSSQGDSEAGFMSLPIWAQALIFTTSGVAAVAGAAAAISQCAKRVTVSASTLVDGTSTATAVSTTVISRQIEGINTHRINAALSEASERDNQRFIVL